MPDIVGALPFLREQAESLMLDTCTITRASGETTIDRETGLPTTTYTTIYTGKCKVQSEAVVTLTPNSGDHRYTVDRWMVHVPVSAGGIKVGDTITITASALDPANIGRKFKIVGLFHKSMATAQRIPVEEVL